MRERTFLGYGRGSMTKRGKLTVVYGPMFAGKTTWLVKHTEELRNAGRQVAVFSPKLDDRYGKDAHIHAHSGLTTKATLVDEQHVGAKGNELAKLEAGATAIFDEAMFFATDLVGAIQHLLERGVDVVAAGLNLDYRKQPFGVMPALIAMADEEIPLTARCYKCGSPAAYTARLAGGAGQIVVGAADKYQPACGVCHSIYEDT